MIDQKQYQNAIRILTIIVLLLMPAYILKQLYFSETLTESKSEYVGKESCVECHEAEYKDWSGSDHDLAMDIANDSTVLGDFNDATLFRNMQHHKMYKKGKQYFVYTDGAEGKMQEYQVKYVFGHYPLQQYLVAFDGGRLQTLALTWNSKDNNWYYMADSVYHGMSVTHTNWLHWTNQAQNWNSMCADCHSTNLQKGYDVDADSYHTTWSEIDVSCEACHGPASEHLKWAALADYARADFVNYGLPIKTSGIDNKQYIDNCARCHSRRSIMGDFNPHSKSIYNHISPVLPREPNWHIDGQIKEEDYVYGSFTQSRMFMEEVACNDCHNVHSGKLILDGNDLCLQCHKAQDYDTKNHTFHKAYGELGESVISAAGVKFEVGSGTDCINCHMHGQNYMGIDYRRDHSFRVPRPDLSEINGSPNACNQCHTDKSNMWAHSFIQKWFGISRPFQYGEAFTDAVNLKKDADKRLKAIIKDDLYSSSIRSLSITYLSYDVSNNELIEISLQDLDPAIRIASVRQFIINTEGDLKYILPLLNDDTKAVRLECYYKLSNIDSVLIPENYKKALKNVQAEQLEVLEYNADFPIGKYNLANYYYQQGDYKTSETFYLKAIEQDVELYVAKMNLSYLYSAMGEPLKAEKILKEFVNDMPDNADALYNYGLILSENKKYKESLIYLIKASDLMPVNSRVDYNIAMLYDFFEEKTKAENYLKKAIDKNPNDISNYSNLLKYYSQNKDENKARQLIENMQVLFPESL